EPLPLIGGCRRDAPPDGRSAPARRVRARARRTAGTATSRRARADRPAWSSGGRGRLGRSRRVSARPVRGPARSPAYPRRGTAPVRAGPQEDSSMKVLILGAGPAGLYLAYLLTRQTPDLQLRVVEQNPPDATFGFGVVFS